MIFTTDLKLPLADERTSKENDGAVDTPDIATVQLVHFMELPKTYR